MFKQKEPREIQKGIYLGKRDYSFKQMITTILKDAGLSKDCMRIILTDKTWGIFSDVFTSDTVNAKNNYQIYEQLGDLSANKFIVMYMYQRFPQLRKTNCVKIVARLRINYGAKKSFSEIARKLGFWPFVSANLESRQRKMKSLLEDVFEAFIGAIELIVDSHTKTIGCGFSVVYKVLSYLFDRIHISLKYEDLYDPKTRLKEMFDSNLEQLGPLVYECQRDEMKGVVHCEVFRMKDPVYYVNPRTGLEQKNKVLSGTKILIGKGYACLKQDAQQFAANSAIKTINRMGIYKKIDPVYYDILGVECKQKQDLTRWDEGLNELYMTGYRPKYNNRYTETPLSYYCKLGNERMIRECLKNGALLNICDSIGTFPMDYVIIQHVDGYNIIDLLRLFESLASEICISKTVYDMYVHCNSKIKEIFLSFSRVSIVEYV